jgi:hypothetical protein
MAKLVQVPYAEGWGCLCSISGEESRLPGEVAADTEGPGPCSSHTEGAGQGWGCVGQRHGKGLGAGRWTGLFLLCW